MYALMIIAPFHEIGIAQEWIRMGTECLAFAVVLVLPWVLLNVESRGKVMSRWGAFLSRRFRFLREVP